MFALAALDGIGGRRPRNAPPTVSRGLIASLVLTIATAGCASLPDYPQLAGSSASTADPAAKREPPRILGANGYLSRRQTAAVMSKLREEGDGSLLARHLAFMQAVSDTPLVVGNSARLLIDGPTTYAAMFKAIDAATDHINLETYIFRDDEIGQQLAAMLIDKQARGVQVNVLFDGIGSVSTPTTFFDGLRQHGIAVCEFNPVNPLKGKGINNVNHRDHRKILVVDGAAGFAGGINISSVYSSGSSTIGSGASERKRKQKEQTRKPADKQDTEHGWRDTQVEIRGPAVAELQKLFLASWGKQACPPIAEKKYFPPLQRQGDKIVRVVGSGPDDPLNVMYAELLSAIVHAEQSVDLTMAYFVPDPQIVEAMKGAVQRGVEVKLILPSFSDFWVVIEAGRSYYAELLAAGVKIYERQDALLHAKTAVIDDIWSTVGSANMDWRSFLHNDEINVIILGEGFGGEMTAMFKTDLAQSKPIDREQWRQRGLMARIKEQTARLWQYWL